MSLRPITPIEEQVIRAAERVVSLRRAELVAQHTGLGRLSSPLPIAPTRANVLAAEQVLDRSVGHLEAERARKAVAS